MKKLILIVLLSTYCYSLSDIQQYIVNTIYSEGLKYKTRTGMSLENTALHIAFRESSFGVKILGDKTEDGKLRDVPEMSLGVFQVRLQTARYVIRKDNLTRYFRYLPKTNLSDIDLANRLLYDIKFNTEMALRYFIINYHRALDRGYEKPWRRALSKHNGGFWNTKYITDVLKNKNFIYKISNNIKGNL